MHFNGLAPEQLMDRAVHGTTCIVVGDAPCKHDEYAQARREHPRAVCMTLNDANRDMRLTPNFVATMHCAVNNFIDTPRMPLFRIPSSALVCGYACNGDQHPRVDFVLSADPIWGTCALFGVLSAMWLGVHRIVLAGCPLSGAYSAGTKLDPWKAWAPYFRGRVRAMSGALIDILEEACDEQGGTD